MKAFKTELNGKRICVAGVGTNGVLSTMADYVGNAAQGSTISLSVSGLFTETDEHAIWNRVDLKVGDKVVLKVIETDAVDQPKERYRPDSKTADRNQKAYIRAWAKHYGWQLLTRPKKSK